KEEDVLPILKKALGTKYPFDVCILDIKMPIINGYEIAKRIRNVKSSIRDLPLIALSNLLERENQKENEENFDGFLHKPVRREKLYQILENVLHKQDRINGRLNAEDPKNRKNVKPTSSVQVEEKKPSYVLLAEDNLINQKLAKLMLTKAGYHVETADTGKKAVDKFISSSGKFDLVIMDMQMPEMDGIEATNLIRKWEEKNIAPSSKLKGEEKVDLSASNVELLPHVKRVPIVALTANAIKGDKEKCLESGMDDYITKPIDRKIFFEVIEKWTSFNKSSQSSIQLD
ncbi:MAG TPA: response regulator, partial [Desulfobacterales bacterium]|nr:response regulator [Desulfobacterales bacterium]